ncbi:MAG: hypothetical protein QM526_01385 [Alphaproteobacteria bacterium]|nr:hypothetical protein [Alphaproteobacteria bacterium]
MNTYLSGFSNVQDTFYGVLNVIPTLILAIVIFVAAWVIGWLVKEFIMIVFKQVSIIDEALKNLGLEEITSRMGMKVNVGKFFGVIIQIFVIVLGLMISLDVLGLTAITEYLKNDVLGYIPRVISAGIIIVIGLLVANLLSGVVSGASRGAHVNGAMAATTAKYAVIIFTVIIALTQLGIAADILRTVIFGAIAAASLALGLSFGLGGQDAAREFIEKTKKEMRE